MKHDPLDYSTLEIKELKERKQIVEWQLSFAIEREIIQKLQQKLININKEITKKEPVL